MKIEVVKESARNSWGQLVFGDIYRFPGEKEYYLNIQLNDYLPKGTILRLDDGMLIQRKINNNTPVIIFKSKLLIFEAGE